MPKLKFGIPTCQYTFCKDCLLSSVQTFLLCMLCVIFNLLLKTYGHLRRLTCRFGRRVADCLSTVFLCTDEPDEDDSKNAEEARKTRRLKQVHTVCSHCDH